LRKSLFGVNAVGTTMVSHGKEPV